MKNKILALIVAILVALGLGAGTAQAVSAPTSNTVQTTYVQPGAVVYNVQVTTVGLPIKVMFINDNYGYSPPRGFASPVKALVILPGNCVQVRELNWGVCNNTAGIIYKYLAIHQVHAMRTR